MDDEALRTMVERARIDREFFHALVFNPENLIIELVGLDRQVKASILALDPHQAFFSAYRPPKEKNCPYVTCGPKSCELTCTNSCIYTCENSCRRTVG